MPEYLRRAMADAIKFKDTAEAYERHHITSEVRVPDDAPQCAMVVFVNSKSGGRHGPELKLRLQQLIPLLCSPLLLQFVLIPLSFAGFRFLLLWVGSIMWFWFFSLFWLNGLVTSPLLPIFCYLKLL
ncbi:hypothetical protein LINGRAHAP2_LOCUS13886 [Linum grandiflorum]